MRLLENTPLKNLIEKRDLLVFRPTEENNLGKEFVCYCSDITKEYIIFRSPFSHIGKKIITEYKFDPNEPFYHPLWTVFHIKKTDECYMELLTSIVFEVDKNE